MGREALAGVVGELLAELDGHQPLKVVLRKGGRERQGVRGGKVAEQILPLGDAARRGQRESAGLVLGVGP